MLSRATITRDLPRIEHDDTPHIGQIYNLTGFESADLEHYARVFSEALGRTIRYRDVPLSGWSELWGRACRCTSSSTSP